jgi:hypothetical protein
MNATTRKTQWWDGKGIRKFDLAELLVRVVWSAMHLAEGKAHGRAFINTIMNLEGSIRCLENPWVPSDCNLQWLSSMMLVNK